MWRTDHDWVVSFTMPVGVPSCFVLVSEVVRITMTKEPLNRAPPNIN